MGKGGRTWWLPYGIVVGSVALALLLTLLLQPWIGRNTFVFFLAAVLISTLYGGLGPGLLAIVLTTFCNIFVFLSFSHLSGSATPNDPVWLSAYVLVALTMTALAAARQRSAAELQKAQAALE